MIKVCTHMKYVLPVVFIYDVFPSHFPEVAIVIFYFPISKAFGSLHITQPQAYFDPSTIILLHQWVGF